MGTNTPRRRPGRLSAFADAWDGPGATVAYCGVGWGLAAAYLVVFFARLGTPSALYAFLVLVIVAGAAAAITPRAWRTMGERRDPATRRLDGSDLGLAAIAFLVTFTVIGALALR